MREADANAKPGRLNLHLLLKLVGLVADSKHNVGNSTIHQSLDLVKKNWLVCKLDQWLRSGEGQWSETCSITTHLTVK